jgi:hypothetical protein
MKHFLHSPLFIVVAVLCLLVGGAWLVRLTRSDALDIEVVHARRARPPRTPPPTSASPLAPSPTDPNLIFAARAETAGALLAALGLTAQSLQIAGRHAPGPDAIVTEAVRLNLIPPGLLLHRDPDRILFVALCECAALEFRFRPAPFALELLSLPREFPRDGDALMLRLPESFANRPGVAMYVARTPQAALPPPFAPAATWTAAGWTRLPFNADRTSPADRQRLWIVMSGAPLGKP